MCNISKSSILVKRQQLGEGIVETQIFNQWSHSLHPRPKNFDSALAQHVHNNTHYFILFENTSIIQRSLLEYLLDFCLHILLLADKILIFSTIWFFSLIIYFPFLVSHKTLNFKYYRNVLKLVLSLICFFTSICKTSFLDSCIVINVY